MQRVRAKWKVAICCTRTQNIACRQKLLQTFFPTLSFLLLGKPKPRLIVTCPYHPSLVENSDPNRLAVACLPGTPDTIQLLNSYVGHWAMWMQYKCALPIPGTISRPRVPLGFHQSSISLPVVFEIEWNGGLKVSVVCLLLVSIQHGLIMTGVGFFTCAGSVRKIICSTLMVCVCV